MKIPVKWMLLKWTRQSKKEWKDMDKEMDMEKKNRMCFYYGAW
jgi:hypothetical protein